MACRQSVRGLVFFFLIAFVFSLGLVGAVEYGPLGPDSVTFPNGGLCPTPSDCELSLASNDGIIGFFSGVQPAENIRGTWNHAIPTDAVINDVSVSVFANNTAGNSNGLIQLFSGTELLSDQQIFNTGNYATHTFQDSRLTDEIKARVLAEDPIELELAIGGDAGSRVDIDSFLLQVTYSPKIELQSVDHICGDGEVNQQSEECDDGNIVNDDSCTNACTLPICGDGVINQQIEQCDGSALNGQTCSSVQGEGFIGELSCTRQCNFNTDACTDSTPMCSVDYIKKTSGGDTYNLSGNESLFLSITGDFDIYGSAWSNIGKIVNVQYNRSSPAVNFSYTNANPFGAFDESFERWRSMPFNPSTEFGDGNHTICCRATDNFTTTSPGTCREFCVDTAVPNKIDDITLGVPLLCREGFSMWDPYYNWSAPELNGCSPFWYYEVEVNDSFEGNDIFMTYSPLIDTTFLLDFALHGHTYSIRVRTWDLAGNPGMWSLWSAPVTIDQSSPNVDITGPSTEVWYNTDFVVSEEDSDDIGLWKCEYSIWSDENLTLDWTEFICNENITIDVSVFCPIDGEEICTIEKRVTDNACNIANDEESFNLDTTAPNTTKIVGAPRYPGFEWLPQVIVDWFITNETKITLICDDADSECDGTFYRIMKEGGEWSEWTMFTEPFTLGDTDGVYFLEYYSTDIAGNIEQTHLEIDKIDLEPPISVKSEEPIFIDEHQNIWVNASTLFTINAIDEEVGVNTTFYFIGSEEEEETEEFNVYERPFSLVQYCPSVENWISLNISYYSQDHLWNTESIKQQNVALDCRAPRIEILNPTLQEAGNVQKCVQSIVVRVSEFESGLNGNVSAELKNESGSVVRSEILSLVVYGLYESSLMDKQLPAGNYTLTIYAQDNIGNLGSASVTEVLTEGVFVENIEPALCTLSSAIGGQCEFTYNICMRGGDSVKFWMDRLGDVITPAMMNANIWRGNESSAYVGLKNQSGNLTDAGLLNLGQGIINGRTQFDLHLNISANVSSQIGAGSHELDYLIRAYAP